MKMIQEPKQEIQSLERRAEAHNVEKTQFKCVGGKQNFHQKSTV